MLINPELMWFYYSSEGPVKVYGDGLSSYVFISLGYYVLLLCVTLLAPKSNTTTSYVYKYGFCEGCIF